MAIVEMQKIHILSLKQHKDEILKTLQKNEVLDIQEMEEAAAFSMDALGMMELKLAEVKSCIAFLEGASEKKKSFIEGFIPPKEEVGEAEFIQTCKEFDCEKFFKKCTGIEDELASLKSLKNELRANLAKLLPWRGLHIPLQDLGCTVKTCIATGKIRTSDFPEFKFKYEKFSNAVDIVIASRTKEETFMVLVYLAAEKIALTDFIGKTDFEPISLPISGNTPEQEILKIRSLFEKTDAQIREYLGEARQMTKHLDKLKYLHDFILEEKSKLLAKHKFADLNYSFVIEGWIRKADLKKVKDALLKVSDEIEVFGIEAGKGEKPPVALTNPRPLSPFELITNIYGTPKSDELDPTLPLSFFFALFFGICLGDFGYGIILMLFAVYFLKKYKLSIGGVKLMRLLLLGGGAAALVGILTGSYFGFSAASVPILKNTLASIQIIDPIKNPLTMLVFSLALGVIQILFGITLQMVHRIMNKQITDALLDDGIWLFFLSSLVFLIVSNAMAFGTIQIASYMSIAGAISLILTQGRHKKNIIQKFLSGLLSLYKVSGYMGDTLSYSRLLALGMSTTIIGSVINILAGMVKSGVPGLGIVLMVVILIFGHIFNLIIGTLGAFVHSTRLQMVEFFSKFYEGGGREFRPFKREAEYTILK